MRIFNSLGSNYSLGFVFSSMFGLSTKLASVPLLQSLRKHYGGEVILTYKGRHALELALRRSGLPAGSEVGINGYTCYVVYEAVEKAGYIPVFIDISKGTLNFGLQNLKTAHEAHKNLKAIIIQNTLGYPCELPEIEKFCKQEGIVIIEDLAHSLGMHYEDGREAGTVGDFSMLSFSQDKPLDVVAGGALVDRTNNKEEVNLPNINAGQRLINRMYPFWTCIIRNTYRIGIGKVLHAGLKKLHLLATPMSDNIKEMRAMTPKAMELLTEKWRNRGKELEHRKKIAKIYQELLPASNQIQVSKHANPSYLRFPVLVSERTKVVQFLKQEGIYIGDTWYDAPIAPKKYMERTNYKAGMCPEAEHLAEHIINLPTHRHINESKARFVAEKVNQWLVSQ